MEEGILVCLSLTRIFLVLQVRGFGSKLFISLILYFELHKVIIFLQPIHFNNMQHEVVFLWLKMLILVVSLTLPIINIAFFKKTLGLYLKKKNIARVRNCSDITFSVGHAVSPSFLSASLVAKMSPQQ